MREKIFRFKQFSVTNHVNSMKVGTDGVLLGAWCSVEENDENILDVGAGTGLISLMMAQRNSNANIIGIELNSDGCKEAEFNIKESQWSDRIDVVNGDFKTFSTLSNLKFDLIVSNPPYFENSIISPDKSRSMARHTITLNLIDFIECSLNLLNSDGVLSFIYPYSELDRIMKIADDHGLYLSRLTKVYSTENSLPKRALIELTQHESQPIITELTIEISRNVYTPEYINLTRDFYIKMD